MCSIQLEIGRDGIVRRSLPHVVLVDSVSCCGNCKNVRADLLISVTKKQTNLNLPVARTYLLVITQTYDGICWHRCFSGSDTDEK